MQLRVPASQISIDESLRSRIDFLIILNLEALNGKFVHQKIYWRIESRGVRQR
jgi:hypothetical protein